MIRASATLAVSLERCHQFFIKLKRVVGGITAGRLSTTDIRDEISDMTIGFFIYKKMEKKKKKKKKKSLVAAFLSKNQKMNISKSG
jgi:hypothetical protein